MAQDIFGRTVEYGGSFPADMATVTFGKLTNTKGAVVQRLMLAYQQMLTRLYEIGSGMYYFVGGRAAGEANMDKIVGPSDIVDQFIATYGDICSPEALQINLSAGCNNVSGSASYLCGDCVATGIGLSVASQDMLITQNCRLMIGWISR
jgi:hypothetical protein